MARLKNGATSSGLRPAMPLVILDNVILNNVIPDSVILNNVIPDLIRDPKDCGSEPAMTRSEPAMTRVAQARHDESQSS